MVLVKEADTTIKQYFSLAAQQALLATCTKARCGTVIIKDHKILGTGFNAPPNQIEEQRKCSVKFDKSTSYDTTCCVHAEWNAILDALKNKEDLSGSTLYFMRVDATGAFTNAGDPFCTVCSRLSLASGIKYFALWNDNQVYLYSTEEYNLISYEPYEIVDTPNDL